MTKKLTPLFLAVFVLIAFIVIGILQYRSQKITIKQTVPLLPETSTTTTKTQNVIQDETPGIPPQTDIVNATKQVSDDLSLAEKNKVFDSLPIRIENFATSVGITTTINIYSFTFDPSPTLRIEIYGINYNLSEINGQNAIAFKESFLEAKKQLALHQTSVKNIQIVFGNRQYIQDTATYWVKTFGLLN